MVSNLNISSKEARKISTSTTPSNLVINKFPNREVYEKIKAKGSLGKDDVNVLEDYPGPELPDSAAADAGKLLQVGADGKAKWGDKLPTALKNPKALTFAGAATGTYDGSEALTITIPEGGSGGSSGNGGLRKMSAVSGYIGIPAAELPQDGIVWMYISKGDGAELYSGTVTIEGGSLMANNLIAVSSDSVIQLNQATTIGVGFVIYGMSATKYVGVWQEVGAGGASINWRGEYSAQTAYNRLDAVSYEGSSYIFASDTPDTGAIPGIDGEWQLMSQKGDTGVSYGSSDTTELKEKVAALNNEGADAATVALLPSMVKAFYDSADYPDNDYTTTHLTKITYPCRADIPVPYTVKWHYNENAMRTTVAFDTKPIGTANYYTLRTYDVTGLNKFPLYNLIPGTTYYYKVTHVMADGSLVEAKSGNFTTASVPWRMLYIDGTQNVRDLGGWMGLNGKKIKYGRIIRGAALSDSSSPDLIVTGKGRLALADLKIQAELNLGAIDTETSIAANCAYKKIGYGNYADAVVTASARAQFKEALEWIVACLGGTLNQSGLPQVERNIYMHCQGGCDRTGTLAFLLLGLLGVSESDLAKEYELSSFSVIGLGRLRNTVKAVDVYDYSGMVAAIKQYPGSTITDKFYSFATNATTAAQPGCGIAAATVTAFKNLMLE